MNRNELSRRTPYGTQTYLAVTQRLQNEREQIVAGLAKHLHRNGQDVQHIAPGLQPPADNESSAIGRCQTCRDARALLEHCENMLLTIELDFRVDQLREEDRKHANQN